MFSENLLCSIDKSVCIDGVHILFGQESSGSDTEQETPAGDCNTKVEVHDIDAF